VFELKTPSAPAFAAPLSPSRPNPETLELLLTRRSTAAAMMGPPGPDAEQLSIILQAGARVPDHGKLAPWRFILITDDHRSHLGARLGEIAAAKNSELSEAERLQEQQRFLRAPVVVTVVSRVVENHKIPVWEQQLSAGAVCQNMLIAASALGFAAQWLTEWYAFESDFKAALGLRPGERVAGFIYLGSAREDVMERRRPELANLVTVWSPPDS